MSKLLYTSGFSYDFSDWQCARIKRVYAGADCVMAITEDGRVLQKVTDSNIAARTSYWTRIKEIAISKWLPGAAIGLVSDGTCMISKRPIRAYKFNLDRINEEIKAWKNIVQVAASDAFFALDEAGMVHYSSFYIRDRRDTYDAVLEWRNVVKLIPGNQCSIFGITDTGRVLATGWNCTNGPHGNMDNDLRTVRDAESLCATGSECEEVILARQDGTAVSLFTPIKEMNIKFKKLDSCFGNCVVGSTMDGSLVYIMDRHNTAGTPVFQADGRITSFAVDGTGNVIAIMDDNI